jgi:hypothetical protein
MELGRFALRATLLHCRGIIPMDRCMHPSVVSPIALDGLHNPNPSPLPERCQRFLSIIITLGSGRVDAVQDGPCADLYGIIFQLLPARSLAAERSGQPGEDRAPFRLLANHVQQLEAAADSIRGPGGPMHHDSSPLPMPIRRSWSHSGRPAGESTKPVHPSVAH